MLNPKRWSTRAISDKRLSFSAVLPIILPLLSTFAMSSPYKSLIRSYSQLSSLYKNPTRSLHGAAASDQDQELLSKHAELRKQFGAIGWGKQVEKSSRYYKVLALLYEVEDYCGRTPSVERIILAEPTASVEHFKRNSTLDPDDDNKNVLADPEVRSLWKAKVRCCVAAIESKRKNSHSDALLHELDVLEAFVLGSLHSPTEALAAWTTLAFVRIAQARIARQGKDFVYVQQKLVSVVECLDQRATEIIEKTKGFLKKVVERQRKGKSPLNEEKEIRELEDDLIFIRQKQTLAIPFNLGLANLQRGLLDSANRACQSARFQFRLHGQACHRLHNELLMIAIKRAGTSTRHRQRLLGLETELKSEILPRLEPRTTLGNPKLYIYGMRELAVIQHLCGKFDEMRATLRKMEAVTPLGPHWKSRISLLRARELYGSWRQRPGEIQDKDPAALIEALRFCDNAFKHATGGKELIGNHPDVPSLLAFIESCGNRNLIDTRESLITYGTAQLFLKTYFSAINKNDKSAEAIQEAIKSAETVKALSKLDNPRLLAMAHLVLADSYRELAFIVEARRHLEIAKNLETQIQHEYVKDRRRAIEERIPKTLTLYLDDFKHINSAEDVLLGWYIGNCEDKSSTYSISKQLGIGRGRVTKFIERQGSSSPYYQLLNPRKLRMAGTTRKRGKAKK